MAESTNGTRTHKAGLFDIRFIIAALLGRLRRDHPAHRVLHQ